MKKLSIILIASLFACKKQLPEQRLSATEIANYNQLQANGVNCQQCIEQFGIKHGYVIDAKSFCMKYCIYIERRKN